MVSNTPANVHLDTAIPNFLIQEVLGSDPTWRAELVEPPVEPVDGYFAASDRPGLGIRLNEQVAAAHAWSETVRE